MTRTNIACADAWHYKQYSDDVSLAKAEQDARDAQRGLWADSKPIPPWDWRKGERPEPTRTVEPGFGYDPRAHEPHEPDPAAGS